MGSVYMDPVFHFACLRPAGFCSDSSHFSEAVKQTNTELEVPFVEARSGCRSFQPRSQTVNHRRQHNREMLFLSTKRHFNGFFLVLMAQHQPAEDFTSVRRGC